MKNFTFSHLGQEKGFHSGLLRVIEGENVRSEQREGGGGRPLGGLRQICDCALFCLKISKQSDGKA